jgi:hypothetical protein
VGHSRYGIRGEVNILEHTEIRPPVAQPLGIPYTDCSTTATPELNEGTKNIVALCIVSEMCNQFQSMIRRLNKPIRNWTADLTGRVQSNVENCSFPPPPPIPSELDEVKT